MARMKRLFVLAVVLVVCAGCEKPEIFKTEAEKATPTPTPNPQAAQATPAKPADWMWKDYKNPLDPSKKKK